MSEMDEALRWLDSILAAPKDYGIDVGPMSVYLPIIRDGVIQLRAAVEERGKELVENKKLSKYQTDAMARAIERQDKAEAKLAAMAAELEQARKERDGLALIFEYGPMTNMRMRVASAEAKLAAYEGKTFSCGNCDKNAAKLAALTAERDQLAEKLRRLGEI